MPYYQIGIFASPAGIHIVFSMVVLHTANVIDRQNRMEAFGVQSLDLHYINEYIKKEIR